MLAWKPTEGKAAASSKAVDDTVFFVDQAKPKKDICQAPGLMESLLVGFGVAVTGWVIACRASCSAG
ncbi:hypothetical protein, partial [Actinoplanes sp. NPDC051411]|uniref:hypothetical protein n=1 Tax=Actinoplanes sp. NPDC051411 TaxID=3155522 RepID=UPI00342B0C1A